MQDITNRLRQLWFKLHLYLALAFGLWFAVLGLAGSLSVYHEDLDELLNPALVVDAPGGAYQSLDRIMAAVRAAHPDRRGSWTLEMPRSPHAMLTAWYERPFETTGEFYAPLMVSVNPYTAEVVASRFWGRTAVTWLLDMHTQLHLGRFGWNVVGGLGLALMVSLVSGLYLWWPGVAGLRRAFAISHPASATCLALDLHRLLGFCGAVVLLPLAFTGFNLAYPALAETLAGARGMGHGDEGPVVLGSAMPNDRPVGLDEAVLLARGPFPHAELRRVATPEGPLDTYRVSLRQRWEVNQRHPATTVWVDRYSGQIREVRNPARYTAGETAISWLWPLHTGEAFGRGGRFLWFVAGLLPGALYVTGMLRWLVGKGVLRDFGVDFGPSRRRLECGAERAGRWLEGWGRRWIPWAVARLVRCAQWLERRYREASRKSSRW